MRKKYILEALSESLDYFKYQKKKIIVLTTEIKPILFVHLLKCFPYIQNYWVHRIGAYSLWGQTD